MTDLATTRDPIGEPFHPGKLVSSRYRLQKVAGSGGMATVWLAHDERLQRPVAIKVISEALASNPAALARFAREARTHAGIQHPNLVHLYDYSVTSEQPYLVMEFVDGRTLSEHLDRRGRTPDAIQALATELLSAIACVHDHGVLHRDIKCGNVLIDEAGHARLTDFGLARFEDSTQITRANEVVGTLRFLAPELIEGRPASRQSDLYALGVLLRTAAGDIQLPAPLPRLISRLTEHDPTDRPDDAHAALAALQQAATNEAPAQRAPTHRAPTQQTAIRQAPTEPATAHLTQAPATRTTHRYRSGSRLRSRTAAISALVAVVGATALAVIGAVGSPAPARAKPVSTAAKHPARIARPSTAPARTLDQRLQVLAGDVRRASKP